jgi:hypothetical protein
MNGKLARRALPLLAGLFLLASCSPPKYAHYTSVKRDWQADVPWGWNVMVENEGQTYGHTAFIGAFEPDFYLGAPMLQVRWHRYGYPHRLADGQLEVYQSADDYIKQTLDVVYAGEREMKTDVHELELLGGRKARHFVVLSPRSAPAWATWGTSKNTENGALGILRQHAYVVVPLTTGFYSLIYPATKAGYPLYEKHFNQLARSFKPLTEGPGGDKVASADVKTQAALPKR